jgi:hypothetical protein
MEFGFNEKAGHSALLKLELVWLAKLLAHRVSFAGQGGIVPFSPKGVT